MKDLVNDVNMYDVGLDRILSRLAAGPWQLFWSSGRDMVLCTDLMIHKKASKTMYILLATMNPHLGHFPCTIFLNQSIGLHCITLWYQQYATILHILCFSS